VLGKTWNQTGGHCTTGSRAPESEFRGDWELGVGWIQERGVPLEGAVSYGAQGLYEGRTEGFWLDDHGTDLREIQSNSTAVRSTTRAAAPCARRTACTSARTRISTSWPSMPPIRRLLGVLRPRLPHGRSAETSAYLHAADGNRLFTVGTRFNLDSFSYRDDRALAEKFTEELPVVTFHWLAQPIAETPWGTPIVVDMATEVGQRRSDYDDTATTRVSDRTLRADQLVELSAPFHLGPLNIRPFGAAHGTFYDDAIDGESEGRIAFDAGVQLGTRLSRTWSWQDEDGPHGVRHVIAPRVSYLNRFRVDDDPSEFFQFDATDALKEQELVRVELRNSCRRWRRARTTRRSRATSCSWISRKTCSPTRTATTPARRWASSTTTCCCGRGSTGCRCRR
jgi:hypothetical protein